MDRSFEPAVCCPLRRLNECRWGDGSTETSRVGLGRTAYCDARRHLRTLSYGRRRRSPAQVPISCGCDRRTGRVGFTARRSRRGLVEAASGDQAACERSPRCQRRSRNLGARAGELALGARPQLSRRGGAVVYADGLHGDSLGDRQQFVSKACPNRQHVAELAEAATGKSRTLQQLFQWAHLGSNQGPPACEAGALPLSYAPGREPRRLEGMLSAAASRP
jgi:hypothetical protein